VILYDKSGQRHEAHLLSADELAVRRSNDPRMRLFGLLAVSLGRDDSTCVGREFDFSAALLIVDASVARLAGLKGSLDNLKPVRNTT
jgi:hypothetical protein